LIQKESASQKLEVGLVGRVRDWPYSSFHRDVAAGLFPEDWAGDFDAVGEFGDASVAQ
jgi:putative transposase